MTFTLKMTEKSAELCGYYTGAIVNGVKVLGVDRTYNSNYRTKYKPNDLGYIISVRKSDRIIEFECEFLSDSTLDRYGRNLKVG